MLSVVRIILILVQIALEIHHWHQWSGTIPLMV